MIFIRSPFWIIFNYSYFCFPRYLIFLYVFVCNFQNKSWIRTVLWLKHCAVVVFEDVEWLAEVCMLITQHWQPSAFPRTPVPCLCPPLFRVGGGRRGSQSEPQASLLSAQYFVLRFVVQLFTFRLLTFLSLVTEITPGLCPGGMKKEASCRRPSAWRWVGWSSGIPRRMALLVGRSWSSYWQNLEACLLPP